MQAFMGFLATLCCAIFTGAAIYVNAVEHPARMSCGIKAALSEWAPSYKRATVMQASLAVLGFVFSVVAWFAGAKIWVLIAGILLVLVVPFTLIAIMPTNNRLLALNAEKDADEAKILLNRWNKLHMVRSALSLAALIIFLLHALNKYYT
ncbi:MAG TPA: DUF1772 domain-containing protein [Dissulfurispiraceae bacterium]|nr:DUF1772 domain-containing protein [Dissulfurispiraceae bacterium]